MQRWWFSPHSHSLVLFGLCRRQMNLREWQWIIVTLSMWCFQLCDMNCPSCTGYYVTHQVMRSEMHSNTPSPNRTYIHDWVWADSEGTSKLHEDMAKCSWLRLPLYCLCLPDHIYRFVRTSLWLVDKGKRKWSPHLEKVLHDLQAPLESGQLQH